MSKLRVTTDKTEFEGYSLRLSLDVDIEEGTRVVSRASLDLIYGELLNLLSAPPLEGAAAPNNPVEVRQQ